MKALSLLQPYGSLMFVPDGKRFETRSWRTQHRGLIAIHASKKVDNWHKGFARKHTAVLWPTDEEQVIPTGAIIGVLDIVDVFTTNEAIDAGMINRPLEREFGDYMAPTDTRGPRPTRSSFRSRFHATGRWDSGLSRITSNARFANNLQSRSVSKV